ncbi:MAG: hypothetical protein ABIN58_02610 [candidate division WOR-3 bacterium]
MERRKTALANWRATIDVYEIRQGIDPFQCLESCFCILYGLPVEVQVAVGARMLSRYLPIFEARWPECREADAILRLISNWLDYHVFPEEDPPPIPGSVHEERYVEALRCLWLAFRSAETPSLKPTSLVVFAIAQCIEQRMENVWAADDPVAAVAWDAQDKLIEKVMVPGHLQERRDSKALMVALDEFLKGRGFYDNLPARVVEWREWRLLAGWLEEIVDRYPELSETEAEAMERDLKRWQDNSYAPYTNGSTPGIRS